MVKGRNMSWFKPDNTHVHWQEICNWINCIVSKGYDHQIIVGADSQSNSKNSIIVVAVCIISDFPGFERVFFYKKRKVKKFNSLYARISFEAKESIDIANQIRKYTDNTYNSLNISIHLDVSSCNAKAKTSNYSSSLISLVKAYDYPNVEIKPNSWAASSIADRYTKGFKIHD